MKITIDSLDRAALDHVRANLRAYDRRELEIQGYGDESYLAHLEQPYSYALKVADRPIACGGAVPFGSRIFFWGFGTDEADRRLFGIHKICSGFLGWIQRTEWQLQPSVLVWDGHEVSLRWLRRLGFVHSGFEAAGLDNEKLLLLEKV